VSSHDSLHHFPPLCEWCHQLIEQPGSFYRLVARNEDGSVAYYHRRCAETATLDVDNGDAA
jgi:hypothetical protein